MIPDLESWELHQGDYVTGPLFIDEHINVMPGTRLREILGCDDLVVRSGHHQAVAQVADELRTAALADDGLVEGVEHPSAWAIGVQWHPEDDDGHGKDRQALFRACWKQQADHGETIGDSASGPRSFAPVGRSDRRRWFRHRHVVHVRRSGTAAGSEDVDAIISMGGDDSAYDEAGNPVDQGRAGVARARIRAWHGDPGVCFGAQTLARAAGGQGL